MKATLGLLALFFFVNVGVADYEIPKQKIVGGESVVPLGEIVNLNVSSVDMKPKDWVNQSVNWKVLDGQVAKAVIDLGDKGIFFGTGTVSKKVLVIAAITNLYIKKDDKGNVSDVSTRTVFVTTVVTLGAAPGPDPMPPDPPKPGPTPTPSFPDGKFKLSNVAYQLAKNVKSSNLVREAGALATAMDGVSSSVRAGTLKDLSQILRQVQSSNRSALMEVNADLSAWNPMFLALQDVLYNFHKNGKINVGSDMADALDEIVIGLRGVR